MISQRNRFQSLVSEIMQRSRHSRKRNQTRNEPAVGVESMEQRALLSATSFVINEVHADPDSTEGDANNDGTSNFGQDEFVEFVNAGATPQDIGGWELSDGFGLRHVFPASTVVNPGQAVVVFGGGTPTGTFGESVVQTASTGSLGLNNSGDTVSLNDGTDSISHSYGGDGGNNQSLTRDPDITGAFVQHTTVSSGLRFSPGFQNDGVTPFLSSAPPIDLVIDYSLDTNGFFSTSTADGQAARNQLEAAAAIFESRIFDSLAAIDPQPGDSWTASISHPATGLDQTFTDLSIGENQIIVYAGGRDLPTPALGEGGPGGLFGSGSASFINTLFRGQTGAGGDPASRTDFGPWGGSITFDTVGTSWNFDDASPGAGENDFFSVALHELAHVLGSGTVDSWRNLISAGAFTGTESAALHGSDVPLTGDGGHWAEGTTSTLLGTGATQEALLDPTIVVGTRKLMTELDFAGLDDIGWDVELPAAPELINIESDSTTAVSEDGTTDTLSVSLTRYANADVTVTLTPSNAQIDLGSGPGAAHVLTFTPASGRRAQTVTVRAIDDSADEGLHTTDITISAASADTAFDGLTAASVSVAITDNDSGPSVLNSLVFNEILADPNSTSNNFDTDGDGNAESSDEFVEIYNTSASTINVGGLQFWDHGQSEFFTIPAGTTLGPNGFLVVIASVAGGSLPAVPAGSFAFAATSAVSFTNGGDNVALFDPNSTEYIQAIYNGDTIEDLTAFSGFSGPATRLGSVLDFGSDLDGVSLALSPDGEVSNPVRHNAIGDGTILATPGDSNTAPDASAPSFAIVATDAVKPEGTGGTTSYTFTVTRDGDTGPVVSVDFAVTGAATDPAEADDFSPVGLPTGTLDFASGETVKVITLEVSADADIEADEGFVVTLSGATAGSSITTAMATGTIENDDAAAPEFSVSADDSVKLEGMSGTTPFTFTVTRSNNTSGPDSIDYAVAAGTVDGAQADDFVGGSFPSGTVEFLDGESTKTVTVNVSGDTDIEADESFVVTLSDPGRGTFDPAAAQGLILDDDTPVANVWINEFHYDNDGGDVGEFVEVAGDAGVDLAGYSIAQYNGNGGVVYGTIDLTGVIDDEGGSGFGALSFTPTQSLQNGPSEGLALVDHIGRVIQFVSYEGTIDANDGPADGMTSVDVGVSEPGSTPIGFSLQRDNSSPAADNDWKGPFDDSPGDLNTIPAPSYSLIAVDAVKAEGDSGTTTFLFTVNRTGDVSAAGTIDFTVTGAVVDGATADDFSGDTFPSGTLSFDPDDTSETIAIEVAGDTVIESDEGFTVTISNATAGSLIGSATADGTIQNDDSAPATLTVVIDEASFTENGGSSGGTVSIPSDAVTDLVVTLGVDDDTEASVPSTVTILAGTRSIAFTVTAVDDADLDGTQTATVTATAAGFDAGSDSVDVTDDEFVSSTLLLNEIMIDPPEAVDTGLEYFELRGAPDGFLPEDAYIVLLEGDSDSSPGTIDHVFDIGGMQFGSNGFLVLQQAGSPYNPAAGTTVFTATGSGWGTDFSSRTTDIENGSVTILLIQAASAPTAGADADDDDNGTLNNNDNGWTIRDGIGNIDGGADDTAYASINVSGNGNGKTPAGSELFDISAQGLNGSYHPDYLARIGNSTGSTSADWVFPEIDGAAPDYTLAIGATVPENLGGAPLDHLGGVNDFLPPQSLFVEITPTSFSENGGTTTARVRRTQADISAELTVTISSDSGRADVDPVTLTIPANQATATFNVEAVNNAIVDGNQTATITASATGFGSGSDSIEVVDDDSQSLVVAPIAVTVTEGQSTTFDVSLGLQPAGDVTVNVGIAGDADLTLGTTTLTFTPDNWDAPQAVTVNAAEDADVTDGTATITVSSAGLANVEVDATEDDNDALNFLVSPENLTVPEGDSRTFDVSLSAMPAGDVVVTVTAAGDADLTAGPSTLTFTPGNWDSAQQVTVSAAEDADADDGIATVTVSAAGLADAIVDVTEDDNELIANGLLINEILFNAPGSDSPNEYIELRGTPNGVIAAGTYLVNIEGDDNSPGDVNEWADLAGLQFGSNGLLVLLTTGNTYSVDPDAGQGIGVTDGDQENASNTFFLIESAVAPDNDDDIDANNDGTPDGAVFAGWSILDGISVLDDDDRNGGGGDDGEFGYASLVFAENVGGGSGTFTGDGIFVPDGAVVVNTGSSLASYVGRIGSSTGSSPADWVAAGLSGAIPNLSLTVGQTFPIHLGGSPLDHIGGANVFTPPRTLEVSIADAAMSENGGSTTATVTRTDGDISAELVVDLASDDITEASVPPTVTIPAGMATASFTIDAVDDNIVDGTQTVMITATAALFADGVDDVDVTDDDSNFSLQVLHASDLEGGVDAITRAANFATIVEALEEDAADQGIASILLSAGDNYIPGPFFSASGDGDLRGPLQAAYQTLFGEGGLTNIREGVGRVDISIMNILGFDAAAVGNHEFDAGPSTFGGLIGTDIRGTELSDVRWLGAEFPYLSANLNLGSGGGLDGLFTPNILPHTAFQSDLTDLTATAAQPSLAPATTILVDGELIGVVGATTQLLEQISSTGDTSVAGPNANDMPALASLLQPVINDLLDGDDDVAGNGDDVNKVILVSHLQQIALEQSLIGLLEGVDIVVAGGSDTLLADDNDVLRAGDVADAQYPVFTTNADSEPAVIVSTDGEYSYVGRLVVEFDPSGVLIAPTVPEAAGDPNVSGAYPTDEAGVLRVTGDADLATAIAGSTKGSEVKKLTDAVSSVVTAKDGTIHGRTGVYLEGRREAVRTQETNMGNLTADANLAAARNIDPSVQISLKNGGGIRAEIGSIDGLTGERLSTSGNPTSGKLAGEVSQLDIENTLRFNNGLSLVTISATELVAILEHAVSQTAPGATPGQFPQVGGLSFSFDPSQPVGSRIGSVAIVDELGNVVDIIRTPGGISGDPSRTIRMVTLGFLAGGGDGYDFDPGGDGDGLVDTGIREQTALATFLTDNFSTVPYYAADTPIEEDRRIQNVAHRSDTVLSEVATREIPLTPISTLGGLSGAEISAFDPASNRLFVTSGSGLEVVDFSNPHSPAIEVLIDPAAHGTDASGITSVAVGSGPSAGIVAVAVPDATVTDAGDVLFYRASDLAFLGSVEVGALPDMLTFSPDGTRLLVANEGQSAGDENEPTAAPNPNGSVSIITVNVADPGASSVQTFDFSDPGITASVLRAKGVRVNSDAPSVAADLEPEFIAVEGNKAFITLQENNAIAVIDDITTFAGFDVDDILGLGTKDHTLPFNALDPSNQDGGINFLNAPLSGLYMPDAIDTYTVDGNTFFVTANEGDGRDVDETRVQDYGEPGEKALDADAIPFDADLQAPEVLGRIKSSNVDGDTDGDGDIDEIHVFGGRSFSIWDEAGNQVWDSGNFMERFTALSGSFADNRSDDKGPEPEGVTLARVGGMTFAFVGLERTSDVMVFNITNPTNVRFVDNIRIEGDISPEGLTFIDAAESPTGNPLLVITNEVSETVTTIELAPALTLVLDTDSISEDGGVATGTVTREGNTTQALTVMLASNDASELTLPSTVTIPAGQPSATFNVTGLNDGVIDGTQDVTILASASGMSSADAELQVTDVNSATVGIAAVANGSESGPANGQFVVSISSAADVDIDVPYVLGGSAIPGTDFAGLTGVATIPAGETSVELDVLVFDDEVAEIGIDDLTVTLTEPLFSGNVTVDPALASDVILILDNDAAQIVVTPGVLSVDESGAASTGNIQVSLASRPTGDVVVSVQTTDATEAVPGVSTLIFTPDNWDVPQSVTITGQTDGEADGIQSVDIELSIDATTAAAEYVLTDDQQAVLVTVNDVDAAPPAVVESVVFFNTDETAEREFSTDRTGQRSIIRRTQVVLSGLVDVTDPSAFVLTNSDTSANVTVALDDVTQIAGKTIVTLSFSGSSTDGNGLVDGNYSLQIDGDTLGVSGGSQTHEFHRLFGDSDGDRDVDGLDLNNLYGGLFFGIPQYSNLFDLNGNGSLFDEIDDFFANFGRVV